MCFVGISFLVIILWLLHTFTSVARCVYLRVNNNNVPNFYFSMAERWHWYGKRYEIIWHIWWCVQITTVHILLTWRLVFYPHKSKFDTFKKIINIKIKIKIKGQKLEKIKTKSSLIFFSPPFKLVLALRMFSHMQQKWERRRDTFFLLFILFGPHAL